MFGLTSKQRNATKMVCYSELTSSLTSAEIKPILILVIHCRRVFVIDSEMKMEMLDDDFLSRLEFWDSLDLEITTN